MPATTPASFERKSPLPHRPTRYVTVLAALPYTHLALVHLPKVDVMMAADLTSQTLVILHVPQADMGKAHVAHILLVRVIFWLFKWLQLSWVIVEKGT